MIQIVHLEYVTSTMDAAKAMIKSGSVDFDADGVPSIAGVMADEQTAGRGQRGRDWHCPAGESLCVTYFMRHRLELPDDTSRLSLMAGIAAAEGIENLIQHCCIGLKWPNDLVLSDKKLGGILIESFRNPDGEWTVLVGVGINISVTTFPAELQEKATSLALNGVTDITVKEITIAIGKALNRMASMSLEEILSRWRNRDTTVGMSFEAETPEGTRRGTAEGIDENGKLLIRLQDSSLIAVETASSIHS